MSDHSIKKSPFPFQFSCLCSGLSENQKTPLLPEGAHVLSLISDHCRSVIMAVAFL